MIDVLCNKQPVNQHNVGKVFIHNRNNNKNAWKHHNRNSSELNSSEYFPEYFKEDLKMERNTRSTDGKIEYDKPILLFLDFMQM